MGARRGRKPQPSRGPRGGGRARPSGPGARTRAPEQGRPRHPEHGRPAHPGAGSAARPRELEPRSPREQAERAQFLERALEEHSPADLRRGEWLWTMREGAERDLIEELAFGPSGTALQPRRLCAALVASAKAPPEPEGRLDVTFARQGFRVEAVARAASPAELADQLRPALAQCIGDSERHTLHVFVPDSARGNELAGRAQALREALETADHDHEVVDDATLRRYGGMIVHVCVCDAQTAAVGGTSSERALSLWPGGRARMRLGGDFPSRAARKLAEAFAWLGVSPGSGELCVDLGAAPGGWSWLLLEKKARVIAVDPARMDPALTRNPRLRHVQGNAFDYFPEEPADWLFCDMAYRPLEVAQMLGRWARRRQTRLLVANFKLPMKRKFEMVQRLRALLAEQGFTGIRTRQLYHDREEITLAAHVR